MRPPLHFNPLPKFGLRRLTCRVCGDSTVSHVVGVCEFCWDYQDGWCIDCCEPFHLDDTGGYNPPCSCGLHCRSCHEAEERDAAYGDDYSEWDEPENEEIGS